MSRETNRTRAANGRSSIYQSTHKSTCTQTCSRTKRHGEWHGYVTVGIKDNGRPDRRHVRGKDKTEVTDKVQRLERERDEGKVRKAGQTWTVKQWLRHWLDTIVAPPVITENAHIAYDVAVRVHLIPGIGAHRIDRLEPEHLERLYRKMVAGGAKPGERTRSTGRSAPRSTKRCGASTSPRTRHRWRVLRSRTRRRLNPAPWRRCSES